MKDYVKEGFFEKCAELGFSKEAADRLYKSARIRGARVPFKNVKNFIRAVSGAQQKMPRVGLESNVRLGQTVLNRTPFPSKPYPTDAETLLGEINHDIARYATQLSRSKKLTNKARFNLGKGVGTAGVLLPTTGMLLNKLNKNNDTVPQPKQVESAPVFMDDENPPLNTLSTTQVAKRDTKPEFNYDYFTKLLHDYYDRNGYYDR